jgi:hypothetical protein
MFDWLPREIKKEILDLSYHDSEIIKKPWQIYINKEWTQLISNQLESFKLVQKYKAQVRNADFGYSEFKKIFVKTQEVTVKNVMIGTPKLILNFYGCQGNSGMQINYNTSLNPIRDRLLW